MDGALLTHTTHQQVSFFAKTTASLQRRKWWVQYDTGRDLVLITATRALAKHAPAHREEATQELRNSSRVKHNWIPWHSLSCPSLFPFFLFVLCVSTASGRGRCTSLIFQIFSNYKMKLLLLVKTNQYKHIRPK